jgi:hypothetical protein
LLPDGEVLANGGSANFNDLTTSVYQSELYNRLTGTWTLGACCWRCSCRRRSRFAGAGAGIPIPAGRGGVNGARHRQYWTATNTRRSRRRNGNIGRDRRSRCSGRRKSGRGLPCLDARSIIRNNKGRRRTGAFVDKPSRAEVLLIIAAVVGPRLGPDNSVRTSVVTQKLRIAWLRPSRFRPVPLTRGICPCHAWPGFMPIVPESFFMLNKAVSLARRQSPKPD